MLLDKIIIVDNTIFSEGIVKIINNFFLIHFFLILTIFVL